MNVQLNSLSARTPEGADSGHSYRADYVPEPSSPPSQAPYAARSVAVAGVGRTLEVRIASDRAELEGAFQMLAANYQARGYEPPSSKLFRFTPFHVLPDTITVVAKHEERVVATLSLVPDTLLLGLPMECAYVEEIASLRQRGYRLAEATSLADDGLSPREFLQVFKTFIKVVMQYHVRAGGDSWVIAVNPRHRSFYLNVLGFERIGPRRSYAAVRGAPAEAFLLDLKLMKTRAAAMYRFVFDEPLPAAVLERPAWSSDRVAYFGARSTQADRRTLRDILPWVEQFGSPPRWLESAGTAAMPRPHRPRSARRSGSVGVCGP